jgi:hypothetical protein
LITLVYLFSVLAGEVLLESLLSELDLALDSLLDDSLALLEEDFSSCEVLDLF